MSNKEKLKKAIALSYQQEVGAPVVVATGRGIVAEHILKEAEANKIPVYEDEKLATLLNELELNETIPPQLYNIVAEILVFVGDMDALYQRTREENK